MEKINPVSALFIKLGRGGKYETDCLAFPGSIRVGWSEIPHDLCVAGNWEAVKAIERKEYGENESTAANQTNQLRQFYESGEDFLWITFYQDHLYWCFAKKEVFPQPDKSRIRYTVNGWKNEDIKGKRLDSSQLSGSLLSVQGFRSTICKVKEFEYLVHKINSETSEAELKAIEARKNLIKSLVEIINHLHWKEFELLTDLIFREAGWKRLGALGKNQKDIDLDLLSPINDERLKVQVKARAGKAEIESFIKLAEENQEYARYYFVVHKPEESLEKMIINPMMKVWLPMDIARLTVNYGLVDWLISKSK